MLCGWEEEATSKRDLQRDAYLSSSFLLVFICFWTYLISQIPQKLFDSRFNESSSYKFINKNILFDQKINVKVKKEQKLDQTKLFNDSNASGEFLKPMTKENPRWDLFVE